ncbi:MAG: hypothetical protein U1E15_11705 [Hyphomicrobiales bacterium]
MALAFAGAILVSCRTSAAAEAYQWSTKFRQTTAILLGGPRDLRWRAHICVWAAVNASRIEGDFAEFGVDTAITSGTVAKYLGRKTAAPVFPLRYI